MRTIHSLVPDPDDLLALSPEELAGVVLEHLNSYPESDPLNLNRYNFSLGYTYSEYPGERQAEIGRALMEAWVWLEREGFVAPQPNQQGEWYFVTRRGREVKNAAGVKAYEDSLLLPRKQLHPEVASKCWASFLRGEYDVAVFQAFKLLEVAVRDACGYGPEEIGVDLMRKAFHAKTGPLSRQSDVLAEREALAHLMAGAIGSYKNPHSHRTVSVGAQESAEMIVLASHLLRIVNARAAEAGDA